MNTKRFIAIALILILVFALTACSISVNSSGGDTTSPTPESTPPPSEEPTPTPPPWGPLTAEFLALLATRNYYIKSDSISTASIGSDGDITPESDPLLAEYARQDDVYASMYSYLGYSDVLYTAMHHIFEDNKFYSINHDLKRTCIYDNGDTDASDDSNDVFPVSSMEFRNR